MSRPLVDVGLRPDLHDLAQVHDGDTVGDVADERQVVRNEEVGQAEVSLQRLEQVDDLRADGDVERRDRLVEQHHLRVQRERARKADALALATRKLVREPVCVLGAEADCAQQLVDALTAVEAVEGVDAEWLGDDLADRHPWIQRRVGILKDDLELTPHLAHPLAAVLRDVLAVEDDLAGSALQQLDDRPTERRLAAPGLTDESESLPGSHREVDAVDGVHLTDGPLQQSRANGEVLEEPFDAEDLRAVVRALVDVRLLRRHAHELAPATGSSMSLLL